MTHGACVPVGSGAVMGVAGTIAGVAAYQGSPDGVTEVQLYSYADN